MIVSNNPMNRFLVIHAYTHDKSFNNWEPIERDNDNRYEYDKQRARSLSVWRIIRSSGFRSCILFADGFQSTVFEKSIIATALEIKKKNRIFHRFFKTQFEQSTYRAWRMKAYFASKLRLEIPVEYVVYTFVVLKPENSCLSCTMVN